MWLDCTRGSMNSSRRLTGRQPPRLQHVQPADEPQAVDNLGRAHLEHRAVSVCCSRTSSARYSDVNALSSGQPRARGVDCLLLGQHPAPGDRVDLLSSSDSIARTTLSGAADRRRRRPARPAGRRCRRARLISAIASAEPADHLVAIGGNGPGLGVRRADHVRARCGRRAAGRDRRRGHQHCLNPSGRERQERTGRSRERQHQQPLAPRPARLMLARVDWPVLARIRSTCLPTVRPPQPSSGADVVVREAAGHQRHDVQLAGVSPNGRGRLGQLEPCARIALVADRLHSSA